MSLLRGEVIQCIYDAHKDESTDRQVRYGHRKSFTNFSDLKYDRSDMDKFEITSNEVHLYWLDNSGANTATIIIQGYELL